jgi:hypothetical protein
VSIPENGHLGDFACCARRAAGPEEIRDVIASDAEVTQQVETALHADETHPAEQQFSHLSKAQKSS